MVRRAGFRAVDRFAAGLAAPPVRAVPAPADLARVLVAFFALLRFAVDFFAGERVALFLRPPLAFFAVPLLRDAEDELAPELVPAVASIDHLPDMTR